MCANLAFSSGSELSVDKCHCKDTYTWQFLTSGDCTATGHFGHSKAAQLCEHQALTQQSDHLQWTKEFSKFLGHHVQPDAFDCLRRHCWLHLLNWLAHSIQCFVEFCLHCHNDLHGTFAITFQHQSWWCRYTVLLLNSEYCVILAAARKLVQTFLLEC